MARTLAELIEDPFGEGDGDIANAPVMTQQSPPDLLPVPAAPMAMMSLSELKALAEYMVTSSAFRGTAAADAAVKIMLGREMGLSPALAIQNLYVVHGRATLNSGTIAAMIKKHPNYNYRVIEHTSASCSIKFYEQYESDSWLEIGVSTFTIDDARTAGLVKPDSSWAKYPRNMLFARALTNGARWYTPDVFGGPIYTPDEIEGQFRVIDDGAGGMLAAPESTESHSSPPASRPAPVAAPVDVSRTEWDDEMKGLPVADLRNETCPLHGIEFFKRGKMKSHAHSDAPTDNGWCNWMDVWKELTAECGRLFESLDITGTEEREQYAVHLMPDLDGVPVKRWRIQEFYALKKALLAKAEEGESEPTVDTETGEVIEELNF